DRHADDVRRQEVARELHALPGEPEHVRQGVRERRLADTRNVLDEEVPAREQAGEAQPDLIRLAENHLLECLQSRLECVGAGGHESPSILRTRASCSFSKAMLRSNSTVRSRSCATTAGGAFRTKFSLPSLTAVLRKSSSTLAMRFVSRSTSAFGSMRPASGTSTVISPTIAGAAIGAVAPDARTVSESMPARRSR